MIYAPLVGAALVFAWGYARYNLSKDGLDRFDHIELPPVMATPLSPAYRARLASLLDVGPQPDGLKQKLTNARAIVDAWGEGDFGVEVVAVDAGGVSAEWVLAPCSDPAQRLLYIHGGGFYIGSAKSHRRITSELAKRAGVSVLAVNYRLMPENRRADTITDCQAAYHWVIDHGPDGMNNSKLLAIAGDSAGGSLALMLAAWARDQKLREADAVIAMAPATDAGLQSPSLRSNVATDPILGPVFSVVSRLPETLLFYINWWLLRVRPTDTRISPVRGDLSRLPPTLLQVSTAEMLLDDSIRYFQKARSCGSPVVIEQWTERAHVFQAFGADVPEADEALACASEFLRGLMQTSPVLSANAGDPLLVQFG